MKNKYCHCFTHKTNELEKIKQRKITMFLSLMLNYSHTNRTSYCMMEENLFGNKFKSWKTTESHLRLIIAIHTKIREGNTRRSCYFHRFIIKTIKDQYLLPRIDDLIDVLENAKWVIYLDLTCPVHFNSIEKNCIVTTDGHIGWLQVPSRLWKMEDLLIKPLWTPAYLPTWMTLMELVICKKTSRNSGGFSRCHMLLYWHFALKSARPWEWLGPKKKDVAVKLKRLLIS